jgi:hypothetical protein
MNNNRRQKLLLLCFIHSQVCVYVYIGIKINLKLYEQLFQEIND